MHTLHNSGINVFGIYVFIMSGRCNIENPIFEFQVQECVSEFQACSTDTIEMKLHT